VDRPGEHRDTIQEEIEYRANNESLAAMEVVATLVDELLP